MAKRAKGKDVLLPAQKGNRRRRTVFVYTEGEVTEPEYIEAVKALVKVPANVRIANEGKSGSDRHPVDLVGRPSRC